MPYIRFLPAAVISLLVPLFAQDQAPTPAPAPAPVVAPPSMAENQIDVAIIKVRLMERIAARLEQEVDMLNQKFKLEGNYYKDKGNRIRLQLKLVGLVDTGSTMLHVCDGKTLWDYQEVLKMRECRKTDIVPIFKKLEDPILDDMFRSLVTSQIGFGGPEAMMLGLRKSVKFDQVSEDNIDGVEVWKLGGKWTDRSKLLGPGDRPISPTSDLPPYIPSNIWMYIGKVNGWPYKIEMIGNAPSMLLEDTRAIDPATNRPIGVRKPPPKVDPSRITLFYKLLPVSEITPGLFSFQPPADLPPGSIRDETEEFLSRLDRAIQNVAAQKKLEAAKGEGAPLLKADPIEIKPDPAGGLGTVPPPEKTAPK